MTAALVFLSAKLQYEEFSKVICKLGVLKPFWWKNLTKKNRQDSQRFLNYTKSSCIIFCAIIFRYSHYKYYLQQESTYFFLEVSVQFFGTENHTRKIANILKDVLVIPTFNASFSVPKCSDINIHIAYKKIRSAFVW